MSQVYGFRSYPPRATIFRNPWTGAAIATPVLDLSSERGPQGYADRSGYGNWGVPTSGPVNAIGVYDEAIKFDGVNDYVDCGSNASLDIAGDISGSVWVNMNALPAAGQYYGVMGKNNAVNAGWGLFIAGTPSGQVMPFSYADASNVASATMVTAKRWLYLAFTSKSNRGRTFIDGVQDAVATLTASDAAANTLVVGQRSAAAPSYYLNGLIELPQVYNGALSPEQVYRQYLAAKDVPIYDDTFESYAVTPVAKAAGSMCGPFRVINRTLAVLSDANGKKWVVAATAGQPANVGSIPLGEAYGTFEFDVFLGTLANVAYVTFIASSQGSVGVGTPNGYSIMLAARPYLYRIAAGVIAANITRGPDGWLAEDTQYSIRIVRRVGGQFVVYTKGGAYPDWTMMPYDVIGASPGTDNTYTTNSFFNFDGTCINPGAITTTDGISNIRVSRVCERPASFPWEFSTGAYGGVVSGSTVWMRCLTAGVTFLPKDLDWQTMTFGLYKGADANVTDVLFLASEIGGTTAANQNAYSIRLAADESVQLIRSDGGVETQIATTAAAYVAITTEYQIKVTRDNATNAYNFYIMGGAYASWTLMFAATLGIYTTSNYWCNDLDADDRITAPQFWREVR